MNDWPDQKIQKVSLWYIGQCSMKVELWHYTLLERFHPKLLDKVDLAEGELPIVSSYISDDSWYVFTSRRIVGWFEGQRVDEMVLKIVDWDFGFFKGPEETEVMVLRLSDGSEARLEFETNYASMAPIYAQRFWEIKYPILDVLKG